MTDKIPQEFDILIAMLEDIKQLLNTKYPDELKDISWFIQLHSDKDDISMYGGNGCAVCAVEAATEWIDTTGIQHVSDEDKKVH